MEASNKDKNSSSHYEEDNGDSDIESRLYAEIHYTNNIIGDESNITQDQSNKDLGNKTTTQRTSAIPELQPQSNHQTINNAYSQRWSNASAQNNTGESTVANSVLENPVELQSNLNSNAKKRPIITDSHQDSSKNKKKKQQNENDNVNDRNTIINPYHKDVANNQQYGIKLLSPAFLHLFFGKSKGKKKKEKAARKKLKPPAQSSKASISQDIRARKKLKPPAQSSKVSISQDIPAPNVPQENVFQGSTENQVIQNETEVSAVQDLETVIDICSESSNDSTEDNSKYNNIEATDKKLTKQNSVVNNESSDDDTSDSNESIFEVPVPPKPAPPVIELNDSDNENVERSDDDSDSSNSSHDSHPTISQNDMSSVSNITENLQEQENYDSENSEPNNLILNCTEVQKGASSISDIKRMSHEISNKSSSTNETNTVVASDSQNQNSQNDLEVLDNAMSREKAASPIKEINSSVTKQVSKSPRKRDRRDVAKEKSFFKPMSDKMKSFYNDSWGGENFDLEGLKSKMPRDPKKWAILDEDLIVSFSRRKRYFGMVCSRCQKDGHRQNQCPEPYKLPTCHMCGMKGHFETACPEKKCLTCGKKQNSYRKTCEQCVRMVCTRCKAQGHMEHFCPDLWRSYHQTVNNTKPNVPKNVKTVMKPQYTLYCCNCARKGHDSENCRKLRWSEHFPVPSRVISYDGPEYSKENFRTESNLSNSNAFCENSPTPSNSSDKTPQRNLIHDKLTSFPRNQLLNENIKVLFKIASKKSIGYKHIQKTDLSLKIPEVNEPNKYNYWNSLSTFLFGLVEEAPGEFLLCQKNQKIVMEMRVSRALKGKLENLFQQYAGRNNFERSYMYFCCDRNPNNLITHLTNKLNEISDMTMPKGILEMYDELKRLKSSENEQQKASAFKDQQLIVCQKELLAALYIESCANDSLIKLKKLCDKIKKKIKISSGKKQKKLKSEKIITVKFLLEYLYYYNNVFVPYEPRGLSSFVDEYKRRLEQRERLKNDPLIFPQSNSNKTNKSTAQSSSFSSTVTTENVLTSSSSSSSQIPSLLLINTSTISQMQPTTSNMQPMNSLIQPTTSSNTARPLLSINTSISSNFHFTQNLPAVGNSAEIISKKKGLKPVNYKRFLNKAKKLIGKAHDSNIPHVRKHVQILENKIKNGIYLYEKDLQMLKVLVNKNR